MQKGQLSLQKSQHIAYLWSLCVSIYASFEFPEYQATLKGGGRGEDELHNQRCNYSIKTTLTLLFYDLM